MKHSLKLFTIAFILLGAACGSGNNGIEAKKASL